MEGSVPAPDAQAASLALWSLATLQAAAALDHDAVGSLVGRVLLPPTTCRSLAARPAVPSPAFEPHTPGIFRVASPS